MPSGFITYIVVLQLLNLGGFARIKNQSRKKKQENNSRTTRRS